MDRRFRSSPWRVAARCGCPERRPGDATESGFSLVEVLVAMLIFLVGTVAVAQLLAVTVRMDLLARSSTEATRFAEAKIEDLAKRDFATDPSVQITSPSPDSLTTNVPNYFDQPVAGQVTRRWRVQGPPTAPTATTRVVTVRVITRQGTYVERTVDVTTILRQW